MARGEILVGDIGTKYQVPTFDDDLEEANFNPSAATTKQLIFKMPGASALLTRDAVAEQVTIEGVPTWCLTYTVMAADVVTNGFHQVPGSISIQGYVVFSSEQKWHSQIVTKDHLGRALKVVKNLS